jgi:Uma2 family endonuclease
MATRSLVKKPATKPAKPSPNGSFVNGGWPVLIPAGVGTLDGFRKWTSSPDFPETGKIAYFGGEIFIDMSPERIDSHNAVKTEIARILGNLVVEQELGEFFADGVRFVHVEAEVSNEPDAMFVLWESYAAKRIRRVPITSEDDFIELEGTPDCVVEIVSPSSVTKDLKTLRDRNLRAGVPEYWLLDARSEKIDFQILRATSKDYETVALKSGWQASTVFGKSFKLTRKKNRVGHWSYRLEIK